MAVLRQVNGGKLGCVRRGKRLFCLQLCKNNDFRLMTTFLAKIKSETRDSICYYFNYYFIIDSKEQVQLNDKRPSQATRSLIKLERSAYGLCLSDDYGFTACHEILNQRTIGIKATKV